MSELETAEAPRSLLSRPTTRYRGTDVDGATLAPEGLWVRGKNLNDMIGRTDFESALWHIWFERLPEASEREVVRARMSAFAGAFGAGDPALEAASAVGKLGVDMVFAAATGFMRGIDGVREKARPALGGAPGWDDEFDQMLACIAGAPYLMRAALGAEIPTMDPAATHAHRMLRLAGDDESPSAAKLDVMNALLTAWHAGFGYVTPTVLVPRCAIGTGLTLAQAIAAGFMSSGPNHVGAALEAMRWLRDVAGRDHASGGDAANAAGAVDAALDEPGTLLFGFGHPLFVADPRPPHLRALCKEWSFEGRHLRLFDAVCVRAKERKKLNPNIDFITAAALLDLGITEPRWGVGVGLCARIAAMAAHAVERRRRPAFGVNSTTARKMLAAVPVGWL